ncbi:class I SAM-dependent methyltransferase [Schlegelella sp. S2-27]|uniref:Class I SAM-dependent methyltransferase n=1 Tax=Caldimonas mangrovi TaxID=2944811 RepID=A0ABT0YNR1_9BURK|nr:class I SAM-dependent methyltransferase [Caldimonas mangrovi]MCM5680362.1 class I SAM-dependent methyltransferase [Caldimonas mangrovi]
MAIDGSQDTAPSRTAAQGRSQLAALRWGWRVASQWLRRRLGLPVHMQTADRLMLEQCILPYYAARPDMRSVLFVGVGWYTVRYESLLAGRRYTTLDIDPHVARHGSRQRHVTGSVVDAAKLFQPGEFDLIVFNGVFGWGLNARADTNATLRGFRQLLRPGGELVVGWNDVPRYRPFSFSSCEALKDFEPVVLPPLGSAVVQLVTDNRHRYEFYRRPLPVVTPAAGNHCCRSMR